MRTFQVMFLGITLGLAAITSARGADADPPGASSQSVPSTWEHRRLTFHYFGLTSFYSCEGLEQQVRSILLHFGARKDAKVWADGCPQGPQVPSRSAWVRTDFYTLAPTDASVAPAPGDIVQAYWAPREINARRPNFMGDGDCELVEQMKGVIAKSFSLRDVLYRTDCVPHTIVTDGFDVKGQALILAAAPGRARG